MKTLHTNLLARDDVIIAGSFVIAKNIKNAYISYFFKLPIYDGQCHSKAYNVIQ